MKTFEELPVWKAGRMLVRRVYGFTRKISDRGFSEQIHRAAVSVPANIAEGHERGSTPDLIHFLFIAKGSAGEVRSQLYSAEDLGYLESGDADALREACFDISRQLSGWIQSMQTPNFRGGPRHHKEPDRAWDRFVEKAGLERQADGRFIKVREPGVAYGRRKTGRRKTEERKTGKRASA